MIIICVPSLLGITPRRIILDAHLVVVMSVEIRIEFDMLRLSN